MIKVNNEVVFANNEIEELVVITRVGADSGDEGLYKLRGIALSMWTLISQGISRSDLHQELGQQYEPYDKAQMSEVNSFIDDLVKKGFVDEE